MDQLRSGYHAGHPVQCPIRSFIIANTRALRSSFLLLIAAVIWGFAFVAQRVGMDFLGPFGFNGVRFLLGALSLLPILCWRNRSAKRYGQLRPAWLPTLLAGCLAGTILFAAASLQQIGLIHASAGKAAFITGLYIVLVPFIGVFLGQALRPLVIIGAILAVAGLFFLCVTEQFTLEPGDISLIIGSLFWAVHILLINHLVDRHEALLLSVVQFLACALLCLIVAFIFEKITWEAISKTAIPLLYSGICSVGIAYTLQVIGQKDVPPAPAAIILSMETVFAAFGGWLILGEQLGWRGFLGCSLMLAGMLVTQLRRDAKAAIKPVRPGVHSAENV